MDGPVPLRREGREVDPDVIVILVFGAFQESDDPVYVRGVAAIPHTTLSTSFRTGTSITCEAVQMLKKASGIRQASDWSDRWDFQGGGSIAAETRLSPIPPAGRGRLQLPFDHDREGRSRLVLDESTLARLAVAPPLPANRDRPRPGALPGPSPLQFYESPNV